MSLITKLQNENNALRAANNYLHGLREIFMFEDICNKVKIEGTKAFHLSVIKQVHAKTKKTCHIYEAYIMEGGEGLGEFHKTRITGSTYEELYSKLKEAGWLGETIDSPEDDSDFL